MNEMYMEEILEHYKHPLNKGKIAQPDIHYHDANPLCGDELDIFIKLDKDKKIIDIKTEAKGCAISQAATSMVSEELKGKTVEEVRKLNKEFVFNLLHIPLSIMRVKCALLSLTTIKKGIYKYLGEQFNDSE